MNRRVALLAGFVVVLGIVGGIAALGNVHSKKDSAFHLEKAQVDRGRIVGKVTATGTLAALVTVQVGSQVSGRIQALHADFGARVTKGQVIARLDDALFGAAAEQARANRAAAAGKLAQAKVRAENAERRHQRAIELYSKKLIAASDLDDQAAEAHGLRAAVESAEGDCAQAQAAYHQARVNLGYTTIVSPISGVVVSRNVDVGQTVAASLQAPTLFTIAEDLRKMQVHAAVSEADVGRLSPGLPAIFTVDAYPQEKFHGVIRQIRDAPQTVQNVVTYDAVIEVDNDSLRLKPGMTANVTFVYAERPSVLRVPSAALRFRPPPQLLASVASPNGTPEAHGKHGKHAGKDQAGNAGVEQADSAKAPRSVWAFRGGTPVEVPVEVGVADGSRVELTSGDLQEGDVLITDAITKADRAEAKKSKGIF